MSLWDRSGNCFCVSLREGSEGCASAHRVTLSWAFLLSNKGYLLVHFTEKGVYCRMNPVFSHTFHPASL